MPPGFRKKTPPGCVELQDEYWVTTTLRTPLDVALSPLSQEHLDAALERGLVRHSQLPNASYPLEARRRLARALSAVPAEESPR